MLAITQVFGHATDEAQTSIRLDKIIGGSLSVESTNRFVARSKNQLVPELVFSCGYFNISGLLLGGGVAVVTRVRDIRYGWDVVLQFVVRFEDAGIAVRFHKYLTQESPCLDETIPLGNFTR